VDFGWSEEQSRYQESVIEFARQKLGTGSPRDCEQFNAEGWQSCGQYGIQGMVVPATYGGSGLDVLTTVSMLESLGFVCSDNGLLFALGAHIWGCEMPLLMFGSREQKSQYLPRLSSGEWIGALAAAEPEAGSDVFALRGVARRKGDGYLLDCSKVFVTNAQEANLMIVLASTDAELGWRGLTTFLVEKSFPGVTVRRMSKMGLKSSSLCEVLLEDCEVPMENRLGGEGAGSAIFSQTMEWERAFILSPALGTMRRLLERCVDYARLRKQFGQPLGKFQLVSEKIVEMRLRLETAKNLLYRVAWLKDKGKSTAAESAMVKLHISDSWVQSCLDAIQVHGGYGYLTDLELEKELRDALASRLFSGTSEIQKVLIAQMMGL
jgi:alkylation response protein AidB-like acyl-CoA dehydrogenase